MLSHSAKNNFHIFLCFAVFIIKMKQGLSIPHTYFFCSIITFLIQSIKKCSVRKLSTIWCKELIIPIQKDHTIFWKSFYNIHLLETNILLSFQLCNMTYSNHRHNCYIRTNHIGKLLDLPSFTHANFKNGNLIFRCKMRKSQWHTNLTILIPDRLEYPLL